MDEDLLAIKNYCYENGYKKTAKKIQIEGDPKSPKLEEVFENLNIGQKRKIKVFLSFISILY